MLKKTKICIFLAALFSLSFVGAAQAAPSDGTTKAGQGIVRCGGNNFLRQGGTEIQFTSYVLRNFDSTNPITINRMRFFDPDGTVLFDFGPGTLPSAINGILGPGNNVLGPNQTAHFVTQLFLPFLPTDADRPLQMEIAWSTPARSVLTLDVSAIRISRARDPSNGAILEERGRHYAECRTIFLK